MDKPPPFDAAAEVQRFLAELAARSLSEPPPRPFLGLQRWGPRLRLPVHRRR